MDGRLSRMQRTPAEHMRVQMQILKRTRDMEVDWSLLQDLGNKWVKQNL